MYSPEQCLMQVTWKLRVANGGCNHKLARCIAFKHAPEVYAQPKPNPWAFVRYLFARGFGITF